MKSVQVKPLFDNLGCIYSCDSIKDIANLGAKGIKELLTRHGAIVFRGFKTDITLDHFKEVTELTSTNFLKHPAPDLRKALSPDSTITNVLEGNGLIHLHGEMYYMPESSRPNYLWLGCFIPAPEHGETTICDSTEFYKNLSASTRRMFESKKVCYKHNVREESWRLSNKNIEDAIKMLNGWGFSNVRAEGKNLLGDFVTSAIKVFQDGRKGFINSIANVGQYHYTQAILEDGTNIPKSVIEEIIEVGEATCKPHRWQKNDILIVDNAWVLHGRRPFTGERSICTRFGMAA